MLAKRHDPRQKPSVPTARADTPGSGPPLQQGLTSATAVVRAEAGNSGYVSSGPIPFDPQPSHSQTSFESSSSAAMLQSPPQGSHSVSLPQRAGSELAEGSAPPSTGLTEISLQEASSLAPKEALVTDLGSASPRQREPEQDDGPMEEIQLHTDAESASNEPQEEPAHYPNTTRQSSYPTNIDSQPSEPTVSNGAPSLEQSTQAASAAIAEAIAAANRAAEESTGGILVSTYGVLTRCISLAASTRQDRLSSLVSLYAII